MTSGNYVIHVDATGVTPDALTGTASRSVRVDVVRPTVTSVATTYGTLYPHRDGYRDSTVLSAHVSEAASRS